MKKTLLGLIAVLLLGVGAYYSFWDNTSKTTMDVAETDFAVTDTSQITRFFIAKKNGSNYHFKRQSDGEWLVNDKWQAEKNQVRMLLGTIHEMRVKAPVPKGMRNGVIKTLAAKGVKVELYNKEGLIKTFYVGDYTADEMGTFFIMEGSEQPYIVHIPRFNGYLTGRFHVKKDDFIDQIIFGSSRKNIKRVTVNYPANAEAGFEIIDGVVQGVDDPDSITVNRYLVGYSNIHSEQLATVNDKAYVDDSLSRVTPMAEIELEDIKPEKSRKILLYKIDNPDKMLGYITTTDTYVWVQYFAFNKLLVQKSNFEKKKPIL